MCIGPAGVWKEEREEKEGGEEHEEEEREEEDEEDEENEGDEKEREGVLVDGEGGELVPSVTLPL